ncbi:hypothetical protein ACOZZ1_002928 [Vibrio fluvialis]
MRNETRDAYCQRLYLNCGRAFTTLPTVNRIIEPTGSKPDPELQPELCKGDVWVILVGIFDCRYLKLF